MGYGKVLFLAMRWFAFILPVPDGFHQECKWSRLGIKLNSHWPSQWHTKSKAKADENSATPPEAGLVHFRSASRTGYADMGANRTRMEAIGKEFASG